MKICENVNFKAFTLITTLIASDKSYNLLVSSIKILPELKKQPHASKCPFYPPISVEDKITRKFFTLGLFLFQYRYNSN